jgi:hypothetical protein
MGMAGLGKTARFYRKNRASYLKKLAKANSHPEWGEQTAKRKKKRVESARERRRAEKNGRNIKGKHYDHKTKSFKSEKENTGQAEKSRVRGSKRNKRNFGKSIKKILK